MRWTPGGDRSNVEDRRGQGGGFGIGGRGMGIGGTAVLLVLSLLFGRNLFNDAGTGAAPGATTTANGAVAASPEETERVEFVTFVLNDAQDVWERLMPQYYQRPYQDATLVLFRDATQTGCGVGQSAMGPFYCPVDQKVYIDLSFYDDLRKRFGAPGDFAQAYVIAHEIGHHMQHLQGTDARVRELQERRPRDANALSVRMELQADCYAGVWGNTAQQKNILDPGDIDEGLNAAAAIGDDRLQRMSQGAVQPESFTHGSSAQRVSWFKRGFTSGNPQSCDTFAGGI
jgi:predicted metalloprotease